ncbi:BON domain-containing protein [Neptuniibacter pectenicola]|jgi:osmotically-inducible protein OsmY|uniref:BON domain-containing protein n=1 Tax=Neptuniibacter pectenicola TaxID=1806669 RepID=A0ABU9TN58_9GAMM|nr:BON domain-containing protein [Neptuniibacter pectenicola]|tara:strand:+ start:80 stop:664 length:585 start_codon:yes stop_codon:yes gene_type:complete|eukprot:gnl/Carplike_NY0171/5754_a7891_170.p2 GENE.gnl/Carplike_NY0171/5754_a7891_170~~gnl/Carplike_NY0171/5754_a7891_170.p2  ORF type:complete len:195 (+),score=9.10 gnl/Carplike_NY0171/5754_a7891_170:1431-2015(+)
MINSKTLLLITGLSLSVIISGCSDVISVSREEPIQEDPGHRTVGSYIDDEVIETLSMVNLAKGSEQMKATNVSVTSYNGVVLLTGQAPSDAARNEAEQIVSQVRKVRKIHNEIKLSGVSSALARTNDTWLTTKVKAELLTNENVEGSRIKVVTDSSTVYLMGLVSPQEADTAISIVRGIPGVEKIVKVFEYVNR